MEISFRVRGLRLTFLKAVRGPVTRALSATEKAAPESEERTEHEPAEKVRKVMRKNGNTCAACDNLKNAPCEPLAPDLNQHLQRRIGEAAVCPTCEEVIRDTGGHPNSEPKCRVLEAVETARTEVLEAVEALCAREEKKGPSKERKGGRRHQKKKKVKTNDTRSGGWGTSVTLYGV